jgi:hypothetical protein
MMAGRVQRHQEQIAGLLVELERCTQKVAALDSSIAFADSRVNPSAVGSVNAHTEKYGGRGGLTNFLESEVNAAGSVGISTGKLTLLAAGRFEIQISKPDDLNKYRYTVRSRLRTLRELGSIESQLLISGGKKSTIWRKRTDEDLFGELLYFSSFISFSFEPSFAWRYCMPNQYLWQVSQLFPTKFAGILDVLFESFLRHPGPL